MRPFAYCVLSFVLSLLTVVPAATFAEEDATEYILRYKFTANEFVHYDVDSKNKMVVEKNQAKVTTVNNTNTLKHYRVIWVDEKGNGTLETMIDRVQMSVKLDDQAAATFDSKQPIEKDLKQFEPIRKSIGNASRIIYSPLGKVVSKEEKPDAQNQGFMIPLPENKVKIGDSWKEEYDVEVSVGKTLRKKVPIRRTFTLESMEDQIAVIKFKTNVLKRQNDPKIGLQLIQKTPSGSIKLDIERGVIISQDVSSDKAQIGIFDGQGAMRAITSRVESLVDPATIAKTDTNTDSK
ncbi:DUF6263 family protein [uncultured Gimesia sp.]|uniref:DUF6263 family protein n=1 Tax=uncultured Gimesia sp. TaxID=1678688 RepID=UPI00260ACC9C|nr:DUF6263 family protein [uncultured Gimesia sp.]